MPSTPVVVLDSTLTDIADAIRGKNGSSDTYKPSEMPAAITAIPSGGGVGIPREVSAQGVYQIPSQSFAFSLPSNATDLGTRALNSAFRECSTLTSVDLSSLTAVSGRLALNYAFYGCTSLASANLGSLVTVTERDAFYYAFYGCTSLASANFPSLTTISGNDAFHCAFCGCTSLASINLNALSTIYGGSVMEGAFEDCTNLASVNFASLSTISGGSALSNAFRRCTSLTSISFPALTPSSFTGTVVNQLTGLVSGVTGCTLHFPASTQAKIETMFGYPNFGGTNTTVLFDL